MQKINLSKYCGTLVVGTGEVRCVIEGISFNTIETTDMLADKKIIAHTFAQRVVWSVRNDIIGANYYTLHDDIVRSIEGFFAA